MQDWEQYLSRYAETEILPDGHWDFGVVIPARCESESILKALTSIDNASKKSNSKNLCVVVINGSFHHIESNQSTQAGIHAASFKHIDICIIDRWSLNQCWTDEDGVGRARKIGMDSLLSAILDSRIKSPWIFTTDADALAPEDYFLSIVDSPDKETPSAYVFDYSHLPEGSDTQIAAINAYESYLKYYVHGLTWAGSPYNYHALGSLLAIHSSAYVKVRGMPKRLAGEDFYILNKLRKIGPITALKSKILLSGRYSNRTPFGTGMSVKEIERLLKSKQSYKTYHPQVFVQLKSWLQEAESSVINSSWTPQSHHKQHAHILSQIGVFDSLEKSLKVRTQPKDRLKAFHDCFDGFKTLRFLQEYRRSTYPDLPLNEALEEFRSLI